MWCSEPETANSHGFNLEEPAVARPTNLFEQWAEPHGTIVSVFHDVRQAKSRLEESLVHETGGFEHYQSSNSRELRSKEQSRRRSAVEEKHSRR